MQEQAAAAPPLSHNPKHDECQQRTGMEGHGDGGEKTDRNSRSCPVRCALIMTINIFSLGVERR